MDVAGRGATPLPTLGGQAWPEAINAKGLVVGSATIEGQRNGVRWWGGTIQVLDGFLRATDVNDHDEIVGIGPEGAVRWRDGALSRLPDLGQGGAAYGINNEGDIVGSVGVESDWANQQQLGLWRNGELVDLSGTVGRRDVVAGYDIGSQGHIVGIAQWLGCCYDAFRLDHPSDSPTWLGGRGYYRIASAVDRWGRTVGVSGTEYDGPSAMVWDPDGKVLLLEGYDRTVVGEGGWWNGATDINERGTVVGYAYETRGDAKQRAVMWQLSPKA